MTTEFWPRGTITNTGSTGTQRSTSSISTKKDGSSTVFLAVQVHVGPPMNIQYKDFLLKVLPDDLPLIKLEIMPPDARKVAPQGQDKPRKPDAE